ncbi:MAG TPA: polymer-forming cytoskeletal protein [Thermoanaerobaculia bacterium]|nr:polymer-forming cytoskeletal protein [Thermoanaerobaculia bacterium]
MSLFRREPVEPARKAASTAAVGGQETAGAARGRATHVAPGTRIGGEITGATELLVDGEIEGEVRVEASVMVGTGGVIRGPVSARVVRVAGKIFGKVHGSERVEVGASGTLEGDIVSPRVIIAEGAFFKGKVEMQGDGTRGERLAKASGAGPESDG